jgi:hypothetical protein
MVFCISLNSFVLLQFPSRYHARRKSHKTLPKKEEKETIHEDVVHESKSEREAPVKEKKRSKSPVTEVRPKSPISEPKTTSKISRGRTSTIGTPLRASRLRNTTSPAKLNEIDVLKRTKKFLKERGAMTTDELEQAFLEEGWVGVEEKTIRKLLQQLRKEGKVRHDSVYLDWWRSKDSSPVREKKGKQAKKVEPKAEISVTKVSPAATKKREENALSGSNKENVVVPNSLLSVLQQRSKSAEGSEESIHDESDLEQVAVGRADE